MAGTSAKVARILTDADPQEAAQWSRGRNRPAAAWHYHARAAVQSVASVLRHANLAGVLGSIGDSA